MKKYFLLFGLLFFLFACTKPVPTTPADPAYRFTPGDVFHLTFAERLQHKPVSGEQHPTIQATVAEFDLTIKDVRADGTALLWFRPTGGQVSVEAHGRQPKTFDLAANRPRDPEDYSGGARYLAGFAENGLFIVVDNQGRWLRDYRGIEPPTDFLADDHPQAGPGLKVYPNPYTPKHAPALFATYMPPDWRKTRSWTWATNLVVFPPMTGYMPLEVPVKITRREGSILTLAGEGRAAGAAVTRPTLKVVSQGDVTTKLEFVSALYEGRFNLDWGLPLESRLECRWTSTREIGNGDFAVSDDYQALTFKIRKK